MLPTSENLFLTGIKSGHFSYKRKPDIIHSYTLDLAMNKISKSKLAKELAFCICTYTHERLQQERYYIAFNAIAINNWDEVAVVQLTPTIKSFSDIVCVNYKLINNNEFKEENDLFYDMLLHEIKLLRR